MCRLRCNSRHDGSITQCWSRDHAFSARHLNLVRAKDPEIFPAARAAGVVVMTKDNDFVLLQERLGPPPAILWVRCGNTSNTHLKTVLQRTFAAACRLINNGESLVEVTDQVPGLGRSTRP